MSYVNVVIGINQFQYKIIYIMLKKQNSKKTENKQVYEQEKRSEDMLSLFKLNFKEKTENKKVNEQEICSKHYPSSIREWDNSIYVYNKNALNIIPQVTVSSMKLIKSYFNLYNFKLERRIRNDRLLRRLKRLSSHRTYVSDGEFKHTSNKVVITLYLLNKQRVNYLKKISKSRFTTRGLPKIKNLFKLIKQKGILFLKKASKNKISVIKTLKPHKEVLTYTGLSKYVINFYKKLIKKLLRKVKLYIYYNQLLFINESKFNYTYLQHLKKYLEKIFNKNVEFNLVNIRRFYLNSDIFSEALTLKIRKNRRKLLRYLNLIKRKVKLHDKKNLYYKPVLSKYYLNNNKYVNDAKLKKVVFNNIKYKHITGFRLEANGRLTRRYTASKSVSKLKYKGNLLNIDSSYRGISSVLLKGNLESNLQYTKLKSKTRIGSFGIKGWVSGN